MRSKAIMARLSQPEQRLLAAMRYNVDTEIAVLFKAVWPGTPAPDTRRGMQQRIGSVISSANHKLGYHDLIIRVGRKRGTYVLTTTLSFAT